MSSYVGIPSNNPTKYLGPDVALVSIVTRNRAPTGADIRQGSTGKYYPIGSWWIISKDPSTGTYGDIYWLSKIVSNVAFWVRVEGGSQPPFSINWQEVTTSTVMDYNNGYVANGGSLVTLTLPDIAPQFSVIWVIGKGIGGWSIAQNAGQTIYYGNATTTPGAGGSISSTLQRDCITLMCITENTEWQVMQGPQGNLNYV